MKAHVSVFLMVVTLTYAWENPVRAIERSGAWKAGSWHKLPSTSLGLNLIFQLAPCTYEHFLWTSCYDPCSSMEGVLTGQDWFLWRDIDSRWSSGVTHFTWDTAAFPDPKGIMQYFKTQGARIIIWITSVVDIVSSNEQEGYLNNYNIYFQIVAWCGLFVILAQLFGAKRGDQIEHSKNWPFLYWMQHEPDSCPLVACIDGQSIGYWCRWPYARWYRFVFLAGILFSLEMAAQWQHIHMGHMYRRDFLYYSRTKKPEALIMSRPVESVGHRPWMLDWPEYSHLGYLS